MVGLAGLIRFVELFVDEADVVENLGISGRNTGEFKKSIEGLGGIFGVNDGEIELSFGFGFVKVGVVRIEGKGLRRVVKGKLSVRVDHVLSLVGDLG